MNSKGDPTPGYWAGAAVESGHVLRQELSPGPLRLHEDWASGSPGLQPVPREAGLCPHPAAGGGDARTLPH